MIHQIQFSNWDVAAITKARIVYTATYTNNYAYVEVYQSAAKAVEFDVRFYGYGWQPVSPSTAGSIPSGYSNKEITFANGAVPASSITSGTFSTDRIPNLSAAKITSGTLGVARGGTGASAKGRTLLANIGITSGTGAPPATSNDGTIYIQYA